MLEQLLFEYYDTVDSTNERVKKRARDGAEEGLVISANRQTEGRGRTGRKWESPKDESVATSMLLYQHQIPTGAVPSITLICGLAVRSALKKLYGLECQIKWPNDIVCNGRKLCGILVEYEKLSNGKSYLIPGIGINVHQKSFSGELEDKATSIDLEMADLGRIRVCRKDIVEAVWSSFLFYFDKFLKNNDLSDLVEEYERDLVNIGRRVRIEGEDDSYEAYAKGISENGGLIVCVDGEEREIKNYEVSVRGLYGYV
ncbi:MAG: biotin--[acetyl-CoA-carboxylase] ligase [Clostridia bacterium]|nr:biotin--[acetyl-CoA-carboxylase] ligase [Clostridia bacterium]